MTYVYPDGIPDILALRNGVVRFIEFKAAGGRTSKVQDYMHDLIRRVGFTVEIISN